ncbi:MAG: hypothetical protein WC303_02095 [Candidatus Paceibacterota bacterium]|jgi:hypothetical protein
MIFEHQSKNKKTLIIISLIILLIGVGFFVYKNLIKDQGNVACTQEAKICPDGSAVGRVGPNCEFSECPNSEKTSGFNNDKIEKAITDYLLTEQYFSWRNRNDSFNFCAIENLDTEKQLFPLYVWVYCGEYVVENGKLETVSGSSGPAKINYPNELSFYDIKKFSYEAPGSGSQYGDDIRKIFPENVQNRIFNFNANSIIERIENTALINILSWEAIKQAINNCEVENIFQSHNRDVIATLKSGDKLTAVEPNIDDVIKITDSVFQKCGKIQVGTE